MSVELFAKLSKRDLNELIDAAEAAITDGSGLGWATVPPRATLERYWKGVLVVPSRQLFVAHFEKVIAGSVQLVEPPSQREMWGFAAGLDMHFVAPWARGHGLARNLVEAAEAEARERGYKVLNLNVAESQKRAIEHYERLGFARWGAHPKYALVGGKMIKGFYYTKDL